MNDNPLRIKDLHHIELWVGNAKQSAFFYREGFGFSQRAYAGLETGIRHQTSYVLSQGSATFLLTAPLSPDSVISHHLKKHGDGARDVALHVENSKYAFEEAVRRGAQPAEQPHDVTDRYGTICRSAIHTYGETIHSFISYKDYSGPFLPGFEVTKITGRGVGILGVDHIAANVELGRLNEWVDWYGRVFGFVPQATFDENDISTEYSALRSVVMSGPACLIKFPINEPSEGLKRSQIQEYLDWYRGPGVQHIALICGDAIHTVNQLRQNGVPFLAVPSYDTSSELITKTNKRLEKLHSLGLMIDRDDSGYLLQGFTRPLSDRPTLFFEIIQRNGNQGFGKRNFRSLFEAIEEEQMQRGNL